MKTTLEIPDDLFRATKARAALRGESLRQYVAEALRVRLADEERGVSRPPGWRRVFGRARREEVAEIDAIVAEDLERVDPGDWT